MMQRMALLLSAMFLALCLATPAHADTIGDVVAATWSAEDYEMAVAVSYAEAGGQADAWNPASDAFCMFQITPIAAVEVGANYGALADPYYCSAQAAYLHSLYGWYPWTAAATAYYEPWMADVSVY
jgi:hypothetical protein